MQSGLMPRQLKPPSATLNKIHRSRQRVHVLAATPPGKTHHDRGPPVARSSQTVVTAPLKPSSTLKDPARLHGRGTASVDVVNHPGQLSLDSYMRLPTDQYSQLDPTMIEPLGGNKFRLKVPKISLFNLWIQPTVDVTVTLEQTSPTAKPRVVLTAHSCHLVGSDLVQKMRLSERFTMSFVTKLSWDPATSEYSSINTDSSNTTANSNTKGTITGDLDVTVLTEVISPFHLLPRSTLESTCNGVLRTLIRSLLPLFMKKLAQDYEKWAVDPIARARHSGSGGQISLRLVVL